MTGPTGDGPVPLWLDHASVEVPELGTAIGHLKRRLGLHATVSPQAADRHGRIYLDRTYLEVAAGTAPATGWRVHLWFLRFDDLEALRAHLEDAGIEHRIGEYEGVDGTWDDVQIRAGPVPLPILVRRTSPPEVAGDWPPTLARPHRCGARTLEAVHVTVGSLEAAVEAYRALLGPGHAVVTESRGPARADARLASGRIVLEEGDPATPLGIVLGVSTLAHPREVVGDHLVPGSEEVAWLDPGLVSGLRLGFVEMPGPRARIA
jgi:hypothetical protein